jgi:hypothetical protein
MFKAELFEALCPTSRANGFSAMNAVCAGSPHNFMTQKYNLSSNRLQAIWTRSSCASMLLQTIPADSLVVYEENDTSFTTSNPTN